MKHITNLLNNKKMKIKKEWSVNDFKTVEKAIVKFINGRKVEMKDTRLVNPIWFKCTFKEIDSILGLAYTSSSNYAGYFICNKELYLDEGKEFTINSFVLDSVGYVYAICWNSEEKELVIPISK